MPQIIKYVRNAIQIIFFKNLKFFYLKLNFFMFLYCFDMAMLKIIFLKKYYFNIFLSKKYFKSQSL
jgi:hypothetical protein